MKEPVLEEGQNVMKVVAVRGQNLYDLSDSDGTVQVFNMPTRLRHVVFAKPGSFVFARVDKTRAEGVVKGDIEAVILDQFLSSLRKKPYWPQSFTASSSTPSSRAISSDATSNTQPLEDCILGKVGEAEDDGSTNNDEWIAAGNPNRGPWARFEISSEEDEETEKEES